MRGETAALTTGTQTHGHTKSVRMFLRSPQYSGGASLLYIVNENT